MTAAIGRLSIGRGRETETERDTSRAAQHILEIYTRDMKITGELEAFARRRFSDVLNSSEQFLSLQEASFCPLIGFTYLSPVKVGTITVNKHSIIFATPRAEHEPARSAGSPGDLVQIRKQPHRVLLHTSPFVIEGFIHLVKEIRLQDALEVIVEPFIAITEAMIYSLATPEAAPMKRHFASVNRDQIATVYLAP